MSNEEYDSDDDWIRAHAVLPRVRDDIRDRALRNSSITLRRRRRVRSAAYLAVPMFAIGLSLGITIGIPVKPAGPIESPPPVVAAEQAVTPPGSIVIDLNDPESVPLALTTATPKQRLAILKAVGDTYLQEYDDAATALPYYRQYVDGLPEQEQFIVKESDTWLLAQLRESKRLEVGYANPSQ